MGYLYVFRDFVADYTPEFIIFLYIGFLSLFIWLFISNHNNRKLLEKYNLLVRNFNGNNLEQIVISLQSKVEGLDGNVDSLKLKVDDMSKKADFSIQNIGFIRYNAFDDMGNEMSYSIAVLDGFRDGFVLTSLYGRCENMNYAKEIKDGRSKINLSAEEIIAIDRAIKSQNESA